MKLTVIVPVFNEVRNLPTLRERVEIVIKQICCEYEIIFIDDHSDDGSAELLRDWTREVDSIRYIRFARNCGSHAACSAGLDASTGDCAVILAADLQDPPETIPLLLEQWQTGSDVVWAAREHREGENAITKVFSRLYYFLMRKLAFPEMPEQGADFLLIDRRVVDVYNTISEKNTSLFAMILWIGFRQSTVLYTKEARASGKSKWTISRKLKLMADSIASFSYLPIRLASYLGIMVSVSAFLFSIHVFENAYRGEPIEGYTSLMMVVLWAGGLQLLILGILGEYLWRAFDQTRGRPRYIVEEQSVQRESLPKSVQRHIVTR